MTSTDKPSVAATIFAVVIAAAPAGIAAIIGMTLSLGPIQPEGIGLGTVVAGVVALGVGIAVGHRRLPLWALLLVWAPLLLALGLADSIVKEGALATSMAAAMERPALFTAFAIQALGLVSAGALLTCGLGSGLSLVVARHPDRIGALVALEAAVIVGIVMGATALARALQLDALNANGAFLSGAELGGNILRVAPLLGGAILVQAVFKVGRRVMGGERQGLVPGAVVAAVGIAGVVGGMGLTADLGATIAAFPGVPVPDGVTALEVDAGDRPRRIASVCTSEGLRGPPTGPILVDAGAGPAGMAACFAGIVGAAEVEVVGRRRVSHIVTDEALAPFIEAPRYGSVVVRRCQASDGVGIFTATTDPAVLFTEAMCFTPTGG